MRNITIFFGLIFSLGLTLSQEQVKTDRVKLVKIAFFNEKLNLNTNESEKFWPVYNDYQSRKKRLTDERKNIMRFYIDNNQNMSDKEVSETLNRYIEIEQAESALLVEYNESFKRILPDEKVLKIYIVEIQFKNYLLKQLRMSSKNMKPRK